MKRDRWDLNFSPRNESHPNILLKRLPPCRLLDANLEREFELLTCDPPGAKCQGERCAEIIVTGSPSPSVNAACQ